MISSATSSDDDNNNNNVSLSVVQTVKKWIRNSWPFAAIGKIDERRPDEARQEDQVLYIHQDECASVDDTTVIDGDRRDEEKCRDDNEASGGAAFEDYGRKEALSASLSNGQHDNDNDDNKAGSRVMDIVMASPKKYFLRSSRRRRSCRFQLDDKDKLDVVARSSNDDESVMASGHFGGLNNDGADSSKVSSTTNNLDGRSKQDNDDNDKEVDELAAPATLPQDTTTTTTNQSCSWTQQEITSLRKAYQQSNPTSPTLWQDISTAMKCTRSAGECQRKWFSLVATPKKRVGRARKNGRVNDVEKKYGVEEDESEEEDDLFDSTPLKCAVQEIENDLLFHQRRRRTTAAATSSAAATAKKEGLVEQDSNDTTFHSPNKIMTKMIKSPLSKRPRMFSPKNKNNNNGGMKNDGVLSPLINRRKGYNTYVNNLRREIGRAQKARRGDDDKMMSRDENIGSCGNNSGRGGGRGKGGGSTANKSSSTIRIKEGKGKSQLSAELLVDGSSFVLNIPQEDSDDENGSDVDLFEEVFRMEDEENEFRCD